MLAKEITRRSRKLSLVLRHKPEAIGLELNSEGWAEVDQLLRRLKAAGMPTSREELTEIVTKNDKQRFAFSEDGRRIRANQGHSIDIDLKLEAVSPPDRLFHGTATRFLASILEQGLRPGSRQHVHLSGDVLTATAVGKRHGSPVVLLVDTRKMEETGHLFYQSVNGVWLTEAVPREYLTIDSYR